MHKLKALLHLFEGLQQQRDREEVERRAYLSDSGEVTGGSSRDFDERIRAHQFTNLFAPKLGDALRRTWVWRNGNRKAQKQEVVPLRHRD